MFNTATSQTSGRLKPFQLPKFFCPSFSHSSRLLKFTLKSIPSKIPQLLPFQNPASPITSPLLQAPHTYRDISAQAHPAPTSPPLLFHAMSLSTTFPLATEASGMFLCPKLTPGLCWSRWQKREPDMVSNK